MIISRINYKYSLIFLIFFLHLLIIFSFKLDSTVECIFFSPNAIISNLGLHVSYVQLKLSFCQCYNIVPPIYMPAENTVYFLYGRVYLSLVNSRDKTNFFYGKERYRMYSTRSYLLVTYLEPLVLFRKGIICLYKSEYNTSQL